MAEEIFRIGVVELGAAQLKIHEKSSNDPPSPIYFNFRKPPKGPLNPLNDDIIVQLSRCLDCCAFETLLSYNAVCGVPVAGNPFALAFAKISACSFLQLKKGEDKFERRVLPHIVKTSGRVYRGMIVLLVDDVVTGAHSKIEAAEALRSLGFKVEDVAVFIDREQGGKEALASAGLRLHALWRLSELLEFYRDKQFISQEQYREVKEYICKRAA